MYMESTRHAPKILWLTLIGFLFVGLAHAQPTPGKEEIVIELPSDYRWKRTRVRKDTKSIRESVYHVAGRDAANSTVKSVRITTIDRRYFPISSASAPTDKLNYHRTTCPDAMLSILERRMEDTRSSVLFSIQSDTDGYCGETVFLSYAVEGPTAYHTIELEIEKTETVGADTAQWSKILLDATVQ